MRSKLFLGRAAGATVAVTCVIALGSNLNKSSAQEDESRPPPTTESRSEPARQFYHIEVEDGIEVGLIVQQLGLKPTLVRGGAFYYFGDKTINKRLRGFGYKPMAADPGEVLSRLVVVEGGENEKPLAEAGVRILLREDKRWVVRATGSQIKALTDAKYRVSGLSGKMPRPRRVRVTVASSDQRTEAAAILPDSWGRTPVEKGYQVHGLAWDGQIDELRNQGFLVEVVRSREGERP